DLTVTGVQTCALPICPDGKATKPQELEVRAPVGKQQEFMQEFHVNKPVLWSLNNPALYHAEVELVADGKSVDRSETPFGIRTLQIGRASCRERGYVLE